MIASPKDELSVRARRVIENWLGNGSDGPVVHLAAEIRRTHAALDDLLSTDSRDTDDIPEYDNMADDLASLVTRLCGERALRLDGLLSKAELAVELASSAGDRAERIALSLAIDICALGRGEPT